MAHYNLALLGFGNVGRALARLLLRKEAEIKERYGITFAVTGIATGSHGSAVASGGIDLEKAIVLAEAGGSLQELSVEAAPEDTFAFIEAVEADALFENSPVNYASGQPAVDHLRAALEKGMHAITANKGPVVHAYRELTELARSKGKRFYFESAVMDGAPVFALYREALPAASIRRFSGVLNSTTNMILTRMEAGEGFDQAVAYCQQIGIAETDPSGDIDGWDAAVKVAALATVLMSASLKPDQVERQGIRQITEEDVARAKAEKKRWKLVCSAEQSGRGVRGKVQPELVGSDSPMYGAEGTTSIVQIESDVLGLLSLIEADPGPHTTAYGLLADFLNAVRMRL